MLLTLLASFIIITRSAAAFPTDASHEAELFVAQTYIPASGYNACTVIPDIGTFMQILRNLNIHCVGQWCSGAEFGCGASNNNYCPTYIIDMDNSHTNCNLHIAGNMIMALSRWSQELATLSWPDVRREKTSVFAGKFGDAVASVLRCTPGCTFTDSTPIDYYLIRAGLISDELMTFSLAIAVTGQAVIALLVVAAWCYQCRPRRQGSFHEDIEGGAYYSNYYDNDYDDDYSGYERVPLSDSDDD
jgi:hypothetical protein